MSRYYDPDGNPITSEEWITYLGDDKMGHDMRRVALDEVDGYRVSTVYLGLDHQHGDGPPLIFETMVFPEDSYSDLYCDRYSTREEAEEGHRDVVARLSAGTLPMHGDGDDDD